MQARLIALGVAFAAAAACIARPFMLVYQDLYPATKDANPNVSVAMAIASELDDVGKVIPIVYEPGSKLIQAALATGKLKQAPVAPAKDRLQSIAKALGCKYLLIVRAKRSEDAVQTVAEVYVVGNKNVIWGPKQQSFASTVGRSVDLDAAAASAGRTIALQIGTEPLKDEVAGPELPSANQGTGTENLTQPAAPEALPWKEGLAAYQSGDYPEAAALLRTAVDRDPLSPEIRATLARTYAQLGMPDHAMEECVRSLRLLPNNSTIRAVEARVLIQLGRLPESEAEYRVLLEHDANSIDGLCGLAEVLVVRQDPDAAAKLYRQARQLAPKDPDIAWALAETLAMQGDFASSLKEKDAALALGSAKDGPAADVRYHKLMDIVSAACTQLGTAVVDLHAAAAHVTTETSADVSTRIGLVLGRVNSLAAYMEQLSHPPQHEGSHARRVFGLDLLAQAVESIKHAVEQAKPDALDEAALSRAEGLREIAGAVKLYAQERAAEGPPK
jgi:tetratricopeptide (TPR) repeat protein